MKRITIIALILIGILIVNLIFFIVYIKKIDVQEEIKEDTFLGKVMGVLVENTIYFERDRFQNIPSECKFYKTKELDGLDCAAWYGGEYMHLFCNETSEVFTPTLSNMPQGIDKGEGMWGSAVIEGWSSRFTVNFINDKNYESYHIEVQNGTDWNCFMWDDVVEPKIITT